MKSSTKILNSLLIASGITIADILHRKTGGLLSGGNYSEPHTWNEIIKMKNEFIILFIAIFVLSSLYFFIMRREVLFICPSCGDKFNTANPSEAYCLDCDKQMNNTKQ